MPYYETVVVVDPMSPEGVVEKHLTKIKESIEAQTGRVIKVEEWGKRKLAYSINHRREGVYFLVEFEGPGETVTELDRYYRVQESILRYLTVHRESPSPEGVLSPVAMDQGHDEIVEHGEPEPEERLTEELADEGDAQEETFPGEDA